MKVLKISASIFFLFCFQIGYGQLLNNLIVYPNAKKVNIHCFDQHGKTEFSSVYIIDSLGRVAVIENYNNGGLMHTRKLSYDHKSNIIHVENGFGANPENGHKVKTVYTYKYEGDKIIKQKQVTGDESTVFEFINKKSSKVDVYKAYHYKDTLLLKESIYEIRKNSSGSIEEYVIHEETDSDRLKTRFVFYNNGRYKSRSFTSLPKSDFYTPSQTESYNYKYDFKYDKMGRPKKKYLTNKGRRYKSKSYKYIE